VEIDEFVTALDTLTGSDLERIALSLELDSLADEVDWWRATIAIDRAIRRARCSRQAARAAVRAVEAVQARATCAGRALPHNTVKRVARAAAEVARGLVVGPPTAPVVRLLLEPFSPVVAVA
jgi:hypothetical protein